LDKVIIERGFIMLNRNFMVCGLVALAMILAGTSCEAPKPWSPMDDQDADVDSSANSSDITEPTETKLNLGDVDQGINIEGRLANADSLPATIMAEAFMHPTKRLDMLTIDIADPVPAQLDIAYTVRATREFADRPVVLRAVVIREETAIHGFNAVLGVAAQENEVNEIVDVFAGLTEMPETMLIRVEAEAHLMPIGTDESTLDAATATSDENTEAIKFNPIRINILTQPGQAEEPAEPEAPAEPAPPIEGPSAPQPQS
jgi:hypothetical protein